MKTLRTIASVTLGVLLLTGVANEAKAQKSTEKAVVIDVSMTCENCKKKIERDIAFEKGVKAVSASVETKKVTIRFDPSRINEAKLVKAIEKLGYTAKVDEKGMMASPASKVDAPGKTDSPGKAECPKKADGSCGKK